MMVGAGFEKVFEVGHAYRAELHNTWRHLNEYVSLDVEMGFIKDEFELMDLEEGFLDYLFKHLNKVCKKELEMYKVELPNEVKIPTITSVVKVSSPIFNVFIFSPTSGEIFRTVLPQSLLSSSDCFFAKIHPDLSGSLLQSPEDSPHSPIPTPGSLFQ